LDTELGEEKREELSYDLSLVASLQEADCLKALMRFPGVGIKVADCVMLFSMEKTGAFPVDVWVKKAMVHFYGAEPGSLPRMRSFAKERFGDLAGFCQQYLFYYAREMKIRIPEEKTEK
jgi:N-glycosylase/DNA lyase